MLSGGLLGSLGLGLGEDDELSPDERMTKMTKAYDAKSPLSAKELRDTRAKAGDWLHGLKRVPYNKKW